MGTQTLEQIGSEAVTKPYYFTFGWGQPHYGKYYLIHAQTDREAVAEMNRRFGQVWANYYMSARDAGVQEYNLKQLT
jgi:hypothetical protein